MDCTISQAKKLFTCGHCHGEFEIIKGLHPVPVGPFKLCQYCWCEHVWGEDWANKCRAEDERLYAIGKRLKCVDLPDD